MTFDRQVVCPTCGTIIPATSRRHDGTRECPTCRTAVSGEVTADV